MLKAIFGLLGLLIVLAVVSSLMKTQLGSLGQLGKTTTQVAAPPGAADGNGSATGSAAAKAVGGARLDGFAATAGAEMPSAQQQIQGVQQSVQSRTVDALKQGTERTRAAQP